MPIILNGTTFNNGGTATFNGSTVKEIIYGTTTVWKAETAFFPSSLSYVQDYMRGSGSITATSSLLQTLSKGDYGQTTIRTSTKVNLTDISTIKFTASELKHVGGTHWQFIFFVTSTTGIAPRYSSSSYTKSVILSQQGNMTNYTASLDVSSLSGSYYIGFGGWTDGGSSGDYTQMKVTSIVGQ